MARDLAKSTLKRFRRKLEKEHQRLEAVLREFEEHRDEVRLSETSSERSPDPNTAEGGSMAFELEKEFSVAQNAQDLLAKVEVAMRRIDAGTYGKCDLCGRAIPVARLEALPHATLCVECARSQ
ncbi:MAG: TraR/DksA family transcriptional regulator [Acidimicrobiia bacterium]